MCKTQIQGLTKQGSLLTKWGLACIGALSLIMNHSSRNDDFWLSLEGYARAYYRVLHEKYGLSPFCSGKKSSLCMLTRHFNQGFFFFPLFTWTELDTVVWQFFYKYRQKVNSICTMNASSCIKPWKKKKKTL